MNDRKLFREMSLPFESGEKANEAIAAFFADLAALREKHKLTNVYCIITRSVVGQFD